MEGTEPVAEAKNYSRRNLGLIAAAHSENHLQSSIYPYYYPAIMSSLNFGYAQIGLLLAASNLIFGLLQGIWVTVSKRWVDRRNLLGPGNMLVGVFLSISGLASNFLIFASARLAGSAASSPQHPLALSMIGDQFESKNRGSAVAIHYSGGNVGTVIGPIVGFVLFLFVGWRGALIIVGIPGMVLGLLLWIFLRDNREHGITLVNEDKTSSRASFLSVIRNRNILTFLVSRVLTSGGRGLGVMVVYIPLYLKNALHLPYVQYTALFIVLALGSVVAPLLGGRITDRMGRRKPMIVISLFVSSAAVLFLILSGNYLVGVGLSLIVLGLFVFNEVPLTQTLLSEMTTAADREGAYSIYFMTDYSSNAVWTAIFGLIIGMIGFHPAFEVMAVSLIGAGIVMLFVHEGKTVPKISAD